MPSASLSRTPLDTNCADFEAGLSIKFAHVVAVVGINLSLRAKINFAKLAFLYHENH